MISGHHPHHPSFMSAASRAPSRTPPYGSTGGEPSPMAVEPGAHGPAGHHVPGLATAASPAAPAAPKLTPVTGRVSRAKKGVPVHVCDQCQPPKVSLKLFTPTLHACN